MATNQEASFVRPLKAAVDLSAKQYYFVKDDGSEEAVLAGGSTGEIGAGFLQNTPKQGETCDIAGVGGGAKAIASATITGPQIELMALATGKLTPAVVAGDIVVALSKESAAAEDIFEVVPINYRKHA